ncbi:MAG: hypothetical protein AAGC93_29030 [Cyanobacteria bacterium P01_F01_bin.53]
MPTPEGLTEAEYQAIVSDAAADAVLDCGAYCFGGGNWLGFVVALVVVGGITWWLRTDRQVWP